MKNRMFKSTLVLAIAVITISATVIFSENKKIPEDFAVSQKEAAQFSIKETDYIKEVRQEDHIQRKERLLDYKITPENSGKDYYLLDSPFIKANEDNYGPVRFMHRQHASSIGDCTVCHHKGPADKTKSEFQSCSACHRESNGGEDGSRPGLKAAYHQMCMNCHQKETASIKAYTDCEGCHTKNTPDHSKLVKFDGNPSPSEITKKCLSCHSDVGEDMITTAHWLWKGHSLNIEGHTKEVQHGKGSTVLNNY